MIKLFLYLYFILALPGCLIDDQDHSLCEPSPQFSEQINIDFFGNFTSVSFEKKNNLIFTENDILLSENLEPNSGVIKVGRPWDDQTFFYRIHPDLSNKKRITSAINHWKKSVGDTISFIEVDDQNLPPNYVEFVEAEGCWSRVGMSGGRQEIGLEKDCLTPQVIHEIGHALGLWHEQSRHDRDDFIDVKWCNIPEDKRHNFLKVNSDSVDFGNYDYNSIMHYSSYAFTLNKFPTLTSKTSEEVPSFHPKELSIGDISSIKCFYNNVDYCN